MIKTKIICTIGPATGSYEQILSMIRNGMNVARINFSHGTHREHGVVIENLKKARKELGKPLAILLDNKGPEVRVGVIPEKILPVRKGDRFFLTGEYRSEKRALPVHPVSVLKNLKPDIRILINDGYIACRVTEVFPDGVWIEMENSGDISSHKGINIPGFSLDLPPLTKEDMEDIRFGCEQGIDIIAASFIRSADHVRAIREFLKQWGAEDTPLIAKIENYQGIHHFQEILEEADGIMVARGDLGVEVPLSRVPCLQKEMIQQCFQAGKPAIIATQMLESMIHHPRPTRAEVSDVANAIYDMASGVMLSAETAVGAYPIEAVTMMQQVLSDTEAYFDYKEVFYSRMQRIIGDVPSAVTSATVNTAYIAKAKAIFVYTSGGYTARLISRWRPDIPVFVMTTDRKVYHRLSLHWGLIPIFYEGFSNLDEAFAITCRHALKEKVLRIGDTVVVTAGSPFGIAGSTNMMLVRTVTD